MKNKILWKIKSFTSIYRNYILFKLLFKIKHLSSRISIPKFISIRIRSRASLLILVSIVIPGVVIVVTRIVVLILITTMVIVGWLVVGVAVSSIIEISIIGVVVACNKTTINCFSFLGNNICKELFWSNSIKKDIHQLIDWQCWLYF